MEIIKEEKNNIATLDPDSGSYLFECPHCDGLVQVRKEDIACAIFRHAVYKSTGEQLNPHAPREVCDRLILLKLINGCGKPFKFVRKGGESFVQKCEYV